MLPSVGSRIVAAMHENPKLAGQVFVGIDKENRYPRLLSRKVFTDHAYVLGATGSGKTSTALVPLLEQLASPFDADGVPLGDLPPHPVVIFDLKETPDEELLASAHRVAQQRGQGDRCLFYSANPEYESMRWNPLSVARSLFGVNQQAGFLMNSLGLVYDPTYGEEYFSGAMRTALLAVLKKNGLDAISFDHLVELVGEIITSKSKRKPNRTKSLADVATSWKDARGLHDKILPLSLVDKLQTDTSQPTEDTLDLSRVVKEGQVLYCHLGSTFQAMESWDVARLLIFSLVRIATMEKIHDRFGFGRRRRLFIFADEFQRIGAKNIVQRFEDVRGYGISLILAHQTRNSLPEAGADLFEIVFQNTAYRQAFTVEDMLLLDRLERLSGLKVEQKFERKVAFGTQANSTDTASQGGSHSWGYSVNDFGIGTSSEQVGVNWNDAHAAGRGQSSNRSFGIREEKVARYDAETNAWVNGTPLGSVIYARDAGSDSFTPTGGRPTLTRSLFFREQETRSYAELGVVVRDPEEFREKTEPSEARPSEPPTTYTKKNDPMKRLIRDLADELADEMPECRVVKSFARKHQVSLKEIEPVCSELGFELTDGNDTVLPYAVLKELEKRFAK